ncbi:MAG: molybdopterin-dependent oxidoreductase, partial [Chloroflexota bacterium]|nr:molybdopterin-dependent oxidoreductase [Chloroflexota bacterium]
YRIGHSAKARTMTTRQEWIRKIPNVIVGVLAGAVAAIVTALVMALSRYWFGIMPVPESVPDRVAPLLDIDTFFSMFGTYGGYNGLKQFGIMSGLRGIFAVGIIVGVVYALVIESWYSRQSPRWFLGASRPAWIFITSAVLAVWIGFVIFLWPVLPANYIGLPYSTARIISIVALLVWWATFAGTVMLVYRTTTSRLARSQAAPTPGSGPAEANDAGVVTTTFPDSNAVAPMSRPLSRRGILSAAVGAALVYPLYELMKGFYNDATFFYDGRPYSGEGIQPITPTGQFYSVTKNVIDPDVDRDLWQLEIRGAIDNDITMSFDDLQDYEQIDQEATLMCISNRIGAGLFSNANWRGIRLRDVLESAGVQDDAYEIKLTGADAFVDTFGMDYALDENTLLVYEINGEPLPRIHGYPVRVVVPGLYGEKNVKWVTRIDVVTEDVQGFYEQQGWGPDFVPPTRSDIFAPRTFGAAQSATFREEIQVGTQIEIRGRAFAADRGIRSVEVTTDDGATWEPAEIYYPGTELTWSLWRHNWTPNQPGEVRVYSRAVDGAGEPQPSEPQGITPQGARGYNIVTATVVGPLGV